MDHPVVGINHELIHFLQAISTPFLFEWTVNWRRLCQHLMIHLSDRGLLQEGFKQVLKGGIPPEYLERGGDILAPRAQPSSWGFSVNDLLEAHAFFLEALMNVPSVSSGETFLSFLNEHSPDPQYRRPYDIFRLWCGDSVAFELFHSAAIASLCSSDPLGSFENVTRMCARVTTRECWSFRRKTSLLWDHALLLLREEKSIEGVGPYMGEFESWSFEIGTLALLESPERLQEFPHHPAVAYAGDDSGTFALLPGTVNKDGSDSEVSIVYEYTLAAISQWLWRECLSGIEASPLSSPRFHWLEELHGGDFHIPIVVSEWGSFLQDDRASVQAAIDRDVGQLLDTVTSMDGGLGRGLPAKAIRRCRLDFVTDRPEEVWEMEEVRAFISGLMEGAPWFPLVLRFERAENLFVLWFGSLAPESVVGNSIDMAHVAARSRLLEFVDAVLGESQRLGADLSHCLLATLGPCGERVSPSN